MQYSIDLNLDEMVFIVDCCEGVPPSCGDRHELQDELYDFACLQKFNSRMLKEYCILLALN